MINKSKINPDNKRNYEISRKRNFRCLGCGKQSPDILFEYHNSGYFCSECYTIRNIMLTILISIFVPLLVYISLIVIGKLS